MRVDLYPELISIIDSARALISGKSVFLWKGDSEIDPQRVSLSFKPVIAEKILHRTLDRNACVSCNRRISYKKDQFAEAKPAQPYLILVHNDFLGPRAGFYNDSSENSLFEKMFESVLGFHPRIALVREILRCHFSKEDTSEVMYVVNCLKHVRRDLEQAGIRGVVIVGKAASLLFPDKTELSARQNKVFEWQGVSAALCPGPNRLTYMREKNYPIEQINAERQIIYDTLMMIKDKIIAGNPLSH